jgi:hypothetical protein
MKATVLVQCTTKSGSAAWVTTTFGVSQRRHTKKLAKAGLTRVAGFGYMPSHFDRALFVGRV